MVSMTDSIDITTLAQLDSIAEDLAKQITPGSTPIWVYLQGDLGAGKTTFSQRFIAAKGYQGRVTSPTYAIMQDYPGSDAHIIHCDLYRLSEPEELDEIGLIELAEEQSAIVLVEWPGKGKGILPNPGITLAFTMTGTQRQLTIQWH